MTKLRRFFSELWTSLTTWLEAGDLVPLMVAVSFWHYYIVLSNKGDPAIIAASVGALVDLGHFRTVRIASRSPRRSLSLTTFVIRWGIAVLMTAVSYSYHHRFYDGDILLALPMPLLIAVLAYFDNDRERRAAQAARRAQATDASDAPTHKEPVQAATELHWDKSLSKYAQVQAILSVAPETPPAWVAQMVGCHRSTVTRARNAASNGRGE